MDIEAVKLIKQKLLEGWIVTCCVKDCVEPLKQFTEVIYIYKDFGLALIKKTEALKRFLEVSDEEFEKLRIILYNPSFTRATGLCYTENWVRDTLDEEEAECIAKEVLSNMLKAETIYIHMLFPA
jgi:hypothetical protein